MVAAVDFGRIWTFAAGDAVDYHQAQRSDFLEYGWDASDHKHPWAPLVGG